MPRIRRATMRLTSSQSDPGFPSSFQDVPGTGPSRMCVVAASDASLWGVGGAGPLMFGVAFPLGPGMAAI